MLDQEPMSSSNTLRDLLLVALGGAMTLAGAWIEHRRKRRADRSDEVRLAYAEWLATFERLIIAKRALYLRADNSWGSGAESAADVRVRSAYTDAHHALTRAHLQLLLLVEDNPVLQEADDLQRRAKTPMEFDEGAGPEKLRATLGDHLRELDELQERLPTLVAALRTGQYLSK